MGNPEIKERQSIVEAHKEKVIKLFEEGLSAVRIREELAADGFSGSYSAVKKYVRKLKGRPFIVFLKLI